MPSLVAMLREYIGTSHGNKPLPDIETVRLKPLLWQGVPVYGDNIGIPGYCPYFGVCHHCDWQEHPYARKTSQDNKVSFFLQNFHLYDHSTIPVLTMLGYPSFTDVKNGVSLESRKRIFDAINSHKGIKYVRFESRPEDVLRETNEVGSIRSALEAQAECMVDIGTYDDQCRRLIFGKNFTRERWREAMQYLSEVGIIPAAYAEVGLPFLNPKEDLEQGIKAVSFAFDAGCKSVYVQPLIASRGSLQRKLFDAGLFKPTTLWNLINLIGKIHSKYAGTYEGTKLEVITDQANPLVRNFFANNCGSCSGTMHDLIKLYNVTQNPGFLNPETLNEAISSNDLALVESLAHISTNIPFLNNSIEERLKEAREALHCDCAPETIQFEGTIEQRIEFCLGQLGTTSPVRVPSRRH